MRTVKATITGDAKEPQISGEATLGRFLVTDFPIEGGTLAFSQEGGNLRVHSIQLATATGTLTGEAQLGADKQLSGMLVANSIDLEALSSLSGLVEQQLGITGAVSATLRYDPWGTLTSSTGSSLPAFRFQGSWADPATNLSWVITRWYAPALGTFISEDSLTGDPADPPSRHLYAYAAGNPIAGWDPDGRIGVCLHQTFGWVVGGSSIGFGFETCIGAQWFKSSMQVALYKCRQMWFVFCVRGWDLLQNSRVFTHFGQGPWATPPVVKLLLPGTYVYRTTHLNVKLDGSAQPDTTFSSHLSR